ncbi:MAG TPA: hypothetical protein VG079_04105, partial [Gaiellaceae bacterium]|nr:hypothetical protein [Gaiellaceae bacterium]
AVRALFRDVFRWRHVDAGDGWLIFALPPAELAVHPAEGASRHEVSLMCDDLGSTMGELRERGVEFEGDPTNEGWGIAVTMLIPGGGKIVLYEPRHETAIATGADQASTP